MGLETESHLNLLRLHRRSRTSAHPFTMPGIKQTDSSEPPHTPHTMSSSSKPSTPRSSSRSKRSTTNLANLRLAPLSAKFTDDTPDSSSVDGQTDAFAKLSASHRSAPTTPRILSRSSSRKYLGGLSRRSSLYENDGSEGQEDGHPHTHTGGVHDETRPSGPRLEVSTGRVPKAKSEAALGIPSHQTHHARLAGHGVPVRRKYNPYHHPNPHSTRTSGTSTPRVRLHPSAPAAEDADDWLSRTAQGVHSALAEQKGQSFIQSRNSRSGLALDTAHHGSLSSEDDDDDEGYEELAAQSARSGFAADDEWSPLSTRASRWGSRYGSRRGSRRGSVVGFSSTHVVSGSRTPLASARMREEGRSGGYFDLPPAGLPVEPEFLDAEDSSADEGVGVVGARLTSLGGLVDRLIGFPLFQVEEGRETGTESEADDLSGMDGIGGGAGTEETEVEARRRIGAENARREGEKERLRDAQRRRFREGGAGEGGGWEDARWLFGRAREAWL